MGEGEGYQGSFGVGRGLANRARPDSSHAVCQRIGYRSALLGRACAQCTQVATTEV